MKAKTLLLSLALVASLQAGENLGQRKAEFAQNSRFNGLNYLAEQRKAAGDVARKTKFRDALYSAATGAGV